MSFQKSLILAFLIVSTALGQVVPAVVGNPVSGSSTAGGQQTFTFAVSDTNGYASIYHVDVLIAPVSGIGSCNIGYESGVFWLIGDDGNAYQVGAAGGVPSSYCSVANPTATGSGNQLTITLPITFTAAFVGTQTVQVYAQDVDGLYTPWISEGTWTIANTFVSTDTATQGSWKGVYGADGYSIIGDAGQYPSYVTVTPDNRTLGWVYANPTSDPRGLQKAESTTDRIAAWWFSYSSFTVDFQFNDTNVHQVALYVVDWTNQTQNETVSVADFNNGQQLASKTLNSFNNGVWLVWNLSGHVVITLSSSNGNYPYPYVNGIFFGGSPGAATSPQSNASIGGGNGNGEGFTARRASALSEMRASTPAM